MVWQTTKVLNTPGLIACGDFEWAWNQHQQHEDWQGAYTCEDSNCHFDAKTSGKGLPENANRAGNVTSKVLSPASIF